ncbi:unnamed protein product [Urochloa decumbens]|uniref:Uncharacterized protein n=1 Tax=Urochloa decumbens TaxID=240449 RepID=A0ABC9E2R5_9POAL
MAPRTLLLSAHCQPRLACAHQFISLPAWGFFFLLGRSSPAARMASLGKLVLVSGLAFLVLGAQDHVKHGSAEASAGGLFITAAAAAYPAAPPEVISSPDQQLLYREEAGERPPIPPSGPSDHFNGEVSSEKPASGRTDGRRLIGKKKSVP